jgi:hypothetical protein
MFSGKTKGEIHTNWLMILTVSIRPGCNTSTRAIPSPAPARSASAASSTRPE